MDNLKECLSQQDAVLFVGSGVSRWSGLPSWAGMIEELAVFVSKNGIDPEPIRAEARNGSLLQAASYGFTQLTMPQIGQFIRQSCLYGAAKPHEIHELLVTLGPRCFITTNYDNLIEESLREWQPGRFYPPAVTNRHLTEIGEIIHARAVDFVFKPHGDAADCESIILTREQYRQLMPQGERFAALDALRTLMVSRPIVYVGFGLRDPDFVYLQDLLGNTYKGAIRDHYAIVADVSPAEIAFWRAQYGVHLVGYTTRINAEGGRDHSAILDLLKSLRSPSKTPPITPTFHPDSSETLLSLARHASNLERSSKADPELPLRVHAVGRPKSHRRDFDFHDGRSIEDFLDNGPKRALLIGLPGAGKSYALRRSVARISEALRTSCLSETGKFPRTVPVLVDLKLYKGDLLELVNDSLPSSLPLEELKKHFNLKIFLDSFNEMPREHWEGSSHEVDFTRFLDGFADASIVIGSRTSDGLEKFDLPTYCLDEIQNDVVEAELRRIGVVLSGRFGPELMRLLSKPYYFEMIAKKKVVLPPRPHPKDIYQSLFVRLQESFCERFGISNDLIPCLSKTAYLAIDRGEEAFPVSELLRELNALMTPDQDSPSTPRDIANWLVSKEILATYTGSRVAFIHQSVTEYLAASELASRYLKSPGDLRDKLSLTRWDQALFLALSLLPAEEADAFFSDVVKADFCLALNAVKYLESGREEITGKLLREIPTHIKKFEQFESRIEFLLERSMPITGAHEPELRKIMTLGDVVASAAVVRLAQLKGSSIKDELILEMYNCRKDFNYCRNGISEALKPMATPDDIGKLHKLALEIADEVENDQSEDAAHGFISGAAHMLSALDLPLVARTFISTPSPSPIPIISARIICDLLWNQQTTEALNVGADLLERGVRGAATSIAFSARQADAGTTLAWDIFSRSHVERLVDIALDNTSTEFALTALGLIIEQRQDLAEFVVRRTADLDDVSKAIILYGSNIADMEDVFTSLTPIINSKNDTANRECNRILRQVELDWRGKEDLLLALIKRRNCALATTLIDQATNHRLPIGQIEMSPIKWWLEWIESENDFFFLDRVTQLFANHSTPNTREEILSEFNAKDSIYRQSLANSILLGLKDLSTDDFSSDAVSFLLASLEHGNATHAFRGSVLGNCATERFVVGKLLPLLDGATGKFKKNLHRVLRQAGRRHGRRYFED